MSEEPRPRAGGESSAARKKLCRRQPLTPNRLRAAPAARSFGTQITPQSWELHIKHFVGNLHLKAGLLNGPVPRGGRSGMS